MQEAEHKWHSRNDNNMDKFNCSRILVLVAFSICLFQGEGKLHCLDYPEKLPPSLEQNAKFLLRGTAV